MIKLKSVTFEVFEVVNLHLNVIVNEHWRRRHFLFGMFQTLEIYGKQQK